MATASGWSIDSTLGTSAGVSSPGAGLAATLRVRTAFATGATASSISSAAFSTTFAALEGAFFFGAALGAFAAAAFGAAALAGSDVGTGTSAGTGVPSASAVANESASGNATVARRPSSVMIQPLRPLTSQPALTSLLVAVVRALCPRGMPPLSSSLSFSFSGTRTVAWARTAPAPRVSPDRTLSARMSSTDLSRTVVVSAIAVGIFVLSSR
ncbi:hypothetical protein D9M72_306710 [compost metagenome]